MTGTSGKGIHDSGLHDVSTTKSTWGSGSDRHHLGLDLCLSIVLNLKAGGRQRVAPFHHQSQMTGSGRSCRIYWPAFYNAYFIVLVPLLLSRCLFTLGFSRLEKRTAKRAQEQPKAALVSRSVTDECMFLSGVIHSGLRVNSNLE
jgi:hypothetical protein